MTTRAALVFASLLTVSAGCNVYAPFGDKESPEAQAEYGRMALDKGDFEAAIVHLEEAALLDPGNVSYKVNLASAYSGRAGLNFINLAFSLQDSVNEGDSDEAFLRRITGTEAFAELNGDTLADLTRSLAILTDDIEDDQATRDVRMLRGIVDLARAGTTPLIIGDLDNDRLLNDEELLAIPDATYTTMMADIRDASDQVKKVGAENGHIRNFTARIDDAIFEIDSQPGETEADRVRLYVASQLGAPELPAAP